MEYNSLPSSGLVRLGTIIGTPPGTGPIPVSRATWYSWIQQGIAPRPVKLGPRTSAWRAEEIQDFLDNLSEKDPMQPESMQP